MTTTFVADSSLDDVFDASGFGVEDAQPQQRGAECNKPGMYHVHVKDAKREGSLEPNEKGEFKSPCTRLDLEILAGSEPDQVGKVIYHRVYMAKAVRDKVTGKTIGFEPLTDKSREQYMRTAVQLGVMAKEDIGKHGAPVRWSQVIGRQAVVRVDRDEEDDFKDKQAAEREKRAIAKKAVYRINFGNFWDVFHEDVKDVPKDPEAMAMAGGGGAAEIDLENL